MLLCCYAVMLLCCYAVMLLCFYAVMLLCIMLYALCFMLFCFYAFMLLSLHLARTFIAFHPPAISWVKKRTHQVDLCGSLEITPLQALSCSICQFQSIQYFINIDILQNILINTDIDIFKITLLIFSKLPYRYQYFQILHINIDIDMRTWEHEKMSIGNVWNHTNREHPLINSLWSSEGSRGVHVNWSWGSGWFNGKQ